MRAGRPVQRRELLRPAGVHAGLHQPAQALAHLRTGLHQGLGHLAQRAECATHQSPGRPQHRRHHLRQHRRQLTRLLRRHLVAIGAGIAGVLARQRICRIAGALGGGVPVAGGGLVGGRVVGAVAVDRLGVQRGLLPQQLIELGGVLAAGGDVGRRHRLDLLAQRGELVRRRDVRTRLRALLAVAARLLRQGVGARAGFIERVAVAVEMGPDCVGGHRAVPDLRQPVGGRADHVGGRLSAGGHPHPRADKSLTAMRVARMHCGRQHLAGQRRRGQQRRAQVRRYRRGRRRPTGHRHQVGHAQVFQAGLVEQVLLHETGAHVE